MLGLGVVPFSAARCGETPSAVAPRPTFLRKVRRERFMLSSGPGLRCLEVFGREVDSVQMRPVRRIPSVGVVDHEDASSSSSTQEE